MGKPQERGGKSGLSGRRALVIGGSGGLGRAVARALAERGASIRITGGHDRSRLEAALAEFRALGVEAEGLLGEISSPSALLGELKGWPTPDILVVAHGPFLQKPLAETGPGDWERMALLDLALPGALASAFLPAMRLSGWGRIVFFGGTATDSLRGFRTNAAYAAAKTGLGTLAKSIVLQHGNEGVAAFVVCPGLADTEYLDEALRAELRKKAPGGTLIPAGEIGETVAALAAADPCLVSGAVLTLDGGLGFARGS